jgi:sporulation and spore germination protein
VRRTRAVLPLGLIFLLLAACGVPVDDAPRDLGDPRAGSDASSPAPDGFGAAVERLYLVREGMLVRVIRRVPAPRTPDDMLADLLAGPTVEERADGLGSALSTMNVTGMSIVQRRATIAVGSPGARSDEVLAYAQIVATLTSQGAEIGTVSFSAGGQPLGVPRADGVLSAAPLTIADYAELIGS